MVVVDLIFLIPLTIIEWVNGYEPELKLNKENPSCTDEVYAPSSAVGLNCNPSPSPGFKKQSVKVLMLAMKLKKTSFAHLETTTCFLTFLHALKLEHTINQDAWFHTWWFFLL